MGAGAKWGRGRGWAVQVDPMEPPLKGPDLGASNRHTMDRVQTLLSNSTCANTPGAGQKLGAGIEYSMPAATKLDAETIAQYRVEDTGAGLDDLMVERC